MTHEVRADHPKSWVDKEIRPWPNRYWMLTSKFRLRKARYQGHEAHEPQINLRGKMNLSWTSAFKGLDAAAAALERQAPGAPS